MKLPCGDSDAVSGVLGIWITNNGAVGAMVSCDCPRVLLSRGPPLETSMALPACGDGLCVPLLTGQFGLVTG